MMVPSSLSSPARSCRPRGGVRRRWLHWKRRLARFLPAVLPDRWRGVVSMRLFAEDRLRRARIENLRELAVSLAPRGVPVKLYLLPLSHAPLFELTCCLASTICETVTFHVTFLDCADRRHELAAKLRELFAKCRAHTAGE